MLRATLKNLGAHKLRLALTALAVVLGVMFMAGTFVLTDTVKNSIDNLINVGTAGKSVVVRGIAQFSAGARGGQDQLSGNIRPLVPESLLATVKAVPGVAVADGEVLGTVGLVDAHGKALGPTTGAPTVAVAWLPDRVLSTLTLRTGHAPTQGGEVVIDAKTASSKKVHLGDMVTVTGNHGPQLYTVVGTIGYATQDTLAGATIVAFDTATAQTVAGQPRFFTEIDLGASSGVTSDDLVNRVGNVMPPHYEAITASAAASQMAQGFDSFLNIFNTFLLVFAGIALLVGAFLIFNTFTILVGQRTRELALLRAVGAGRGQVIASVLGEAALTGLFGSAVGLGLGILVALGVSKLFKNFLSLASTNLEILPRTVIVSLGVGTLLTLISAIFPALRASRVPPVAAMREDAVVAEAPLRRRVALGIVVLAAGGAALAFGLVNKSLAPVGGGAVGIFLGTAMLVPLVAGPLARVIGAPLPLLQGVSGRLGKENSARNPRRTAATSSALMIGIAVVAAIATLVGSLLAAFNGLFDKSFQANYVISTSTGQDFPGTAAEAAVRSAPGVTAMSGFSAIFIHIKGASHEVGGIDPVQGPKVFRINVVRGSIDSLSREQLLIDQTTATNDHLKVGDSLTMTFDVTGDQSFTIGGIYDDNRLLGAYTLSNATIAANANVLRDSVILAATTATTPAIQDGLRKSLAGFPDLKVRTGQEFKNDQKKQIKGFLNLVYGLLFLSIAIAIVGVINTLVLSVLERTREIGLVRSIGMLRRQVRRMIRGEAVVVSLIGSVVGLVLGIALGAALVKALGSSGIATASIVIPVPTIIEVLVATFVLAIFAALFPAHRASKLDVLKAISTV